MSEPVRIQEMEPVFGHGRPLSSPLAGEVAAQRSMGGAAAGYCAMGHVPLGCADSPPSLPSHIKGEGAFCRPGLIESDQHLPDPSAGMAP